MSIKFVTACGSGLGSSLIISMNITKVLKELNIDGEVEHCDITSVSTKQADYYVFGKDIAQSNAVTSLDHDKFIILENLLSSKELTEKIQEKLNK